MIRDLAGTYYPPPPVAASIITSPNAPVFGWLITQMGTGVVGGSEVGVDRDVE